MLWSFTKHGEYRRAYEAESAAAVHATWIRLRSPREADRWIAGVGTDETSTGERRQDFQTGATFLR